MEETHSASSAWATAPRPWGDWRRQDGVRGGRRARRRGAARRSSRRSPRSPARASRASSRRLALRAEPAGGAWRCAAAARGRTCPTRRSSRRSAPTWPARSCARRISDAARVEDLVRPCLPSKRQWGYRNKLELGACTRRERRVPCWASIGKGRTTWRRRRSCPLAHDAIAQGAQGAARRAALRAGRAGPGHLPGGRARQRAHARRGGGPVDAAPGPFPRTHVAKMVKSALKATSIVRVLADPGKARKIKGVETLDGTRMLGRAGGRRAAGGQRAVVLPGEHRAGREAGRRRAGRAGRRWARTAPRAGRLLVADLYAGGGTFSVPLARAGADVMAVESAGSSVRDLRRNAEMNGVRHRGHRRRRGPRAARAGRAGRARGGPAARGPGRRGGGEHRRRRARARGLRELQPGHLGARRGPLRAQRLPPGARAARRPVPADLPRGGVEPFVRA